MRYRELFDFDPIESVIQLRNADQEAGARQLARSYVVSDRMAEQLARVVIPQIQLDTPTEHKGVLIVGNYGTGKSHLMSVVSGVAEYPSLATELDNGTVRQAAASIAGRFKVLRVELGGVRGSLRDILVREIEQALTGWGVAYSFPPDTALANNKDAIIGAVAAFQQRYPEQGILLVVDELLDYLRARNLQELILDLGFLRELGEVTALTAFRFLGGLQETLFDNPRFGFAAQQLRRVRDRFELVHIAREDIAFVVSRRLLRKSPEQLARAAEHLRQFAPLYGQLGDRISEYAQLFPIHPAYVETFERIRVAEKREVLKTFSLAMRGLLDEEVPADQPGLISYDDYWGVLRENPAMRGLPGVSEVADKSSVLEGLVRTNYTRPQLKPMALRIVHALSVQRLTTDEITRPLGVTPEQLRDDLCLYVPLPQRSAEFLLDQVQVALREISRTVSGQYLSFNEANGQWYLDVRKDIDFDAKIRERGEALGDDELNRYFFDALVQVFGLSASTHVPGFTIWPHEVRWDDKHVMRPGYLFFGAPDERSTAQPPRDFYVYVIPPFNGRTYHDEGQPDEAIFELTGAGEDFQELVRRYAGARAMANEAATHRDVYAGKSTEHLARLSRWLRETFPAQLRVKHQGRPRPIREVLAEMRSTASQGPDELVNLVAAQLLAPHFADLYPRYPAFRRLSQPVTEKARADTAMEAIRGLGAARRTAQATAVLEGLELLDGDAVRPERSRYARHFRDLLSAKPPGQVVNRGEVITTLAPGAIPVEKDPEFGLEPEWVAVLLLALVYAGEAVLAPARGAALDAAALDRAAGLSMEELVNFRHYERPRTLPLATWIAVFEGLGLHAGLIRDEQGRDEAVRRLQEQVNAELQRVVTVQGRLQQGPRLWNTPLFTDSFSYGVQAGSVVSRAETPDVSLHQGTFLAPLRAYKDLLENLRPFTTVGKLVNLSLSSNNVQAALAGRADLERAERLMGLVEQLQPTTTYLAEASGNLPKEHEWSAQARAERSALLDDVRRGAKGEPAPGAQELARRLDALKRAYVTAYAAEHQRLVLGPAQADRKQRLERDPRLAALTTLAGIPLLTRAELDNRRQALASLPTCRQFQEGVLAESPTCPYCSLKPAQRPGGNAAQTLDQFDAIFDDLLARWRQSLRANLEAQAARDSRAAMTASERRPIEQFLAQRDDATDIPAGFVEAATRALRGIQSVTLDAAALLGALKRGGLPCTVQELVDRFGAYVRAQMQGHDQAATRLTLVDRREQAAITSAVQVPPLGVPIAPPAGYGERLDA